jgi:hypothetical protein
MTPRPAEYLPNTPFFASATPNTLMPCHGFVSPSSPLIAAQTLASSDEDDYFIAVLSTIFREKLCVLALVNMAYTGLVWFARVIQYLFFGELRVVESQACCTARNGRPWLLGRCFANGADARTYSPLAHPS